MTDKIHMSPTRAFHFTANPLRAYQDYIGEIEWWEGNKDALLFGTIVHNVAEGREPTQDMSDDEKDLLISKAGKTKGQLKKAYVDAEIIGKHVHNYIAKYGNAEFEKDFAYKSETGQGVKFTATGRPDMLTENSVYDFKTVASKDFDWFDKNGTLHEDMQEQYKKQISWYAFLEEKQEAHIIFIKKDAEKPWIKELVLNHDDILRYANEMSDEIEQAVHYVDCPENLPAINDGSKWAYDHFGGVINE